MSTTTRPAVAPRLQATRVSHRVDGRDLLGDVSLTVAPGELVAIIGGSGAGKTTLLESLGGVQRPTGGTVTLDGLDIASATARHAVGFVPQDDIIHVDLPLRRTLTYAARLRLPAATADVDVELAVERVLEELDLAERGELRVRDLSGGQRKRASIAVELLTAPHVLLLDEPTSGLDPATAAEVLGVLRRLADNGTTVVLTSHAPTDVHRCDRVIVLAIGGRLVFDGAPARAPMWFGVDRLDDVYEALGRVDVDALADRLAAPQPATAPTESTGTPWRAQAAGAVSPDRRGIRRVGAPAGPGFLRQMATLSRRGGDLMIGNRLTASILVGSPALVIAMLAMLFRADGFAGGDAIGAIQLVYWIAFAGFFFGLTYGLLQVVVEFPILKRERSGGLSIWAYVTSKVVVLLPLLACVDVALFAVLRGLDRLPAADGDVWIGLAVAFLLDAAAGLALGLLTSALVTNAAQATLALPMLCFPQVLFAGAMIPVTVMADGGRAISEAMSNRWAFEAVGRILDLPARFPGDPTPLGGWAPAFAGSATPPLLALLAMVAVCGVGTVLVLRRRTSPR